MNSKKPYIVLFLFALLTIALIAWVVYASWLYYAASCKQIKEFPVPTHVPSRCIGATHE